MLSADDKKELNRFRARPLARWAIGVSIFMHGLLWLAAPFIPAPPTTREHTFEVALLPQTSPKTAPQSTPAPRRQTKRTTPQKRIIKQRVRYQETPRPIQRTIKRPRQTANTRSAALPQNAPKRAFRANRVFPTAPSQNSPSNPLAQRDNRGAAPSSSGAAPQSRSLPSRAFNGPHLPSSILPKRDSEFAALPETSGLQTGERTNRRTRTRQKGSGFEVSLPGESTTSAGEAAASNAHPRPTGLQSEGNRSFTFDSASSGPRASRQSLGGNVPTYAQPGAPRPTNKNEEANDDTGNLKNAAPRRTRFARHDKNDDAELFSNPAPTPLSPSPSLPNTQKPGRILPAPTPDYPAEARAKNQTGIVKVRVKVDETGKIIDVEIVSSSGSPSLDKRAVKAARQRKYEPRKHGDTAVATSFPLTFKFDLTD